MFDNRRKDECLPDLFKTIFKKDYTILDVGCGYGRLTIPLAKMGYHIEGIDLSPNLIEKAKELAKKEELSIPFLVGDMLNLPYKDNSFDLIICMWSTFSYMLTKKDQIITLEDMLRILKNGGTIIIDLPFATQESIKSFTVLEGNVIKDTILGVDHTVFLHTEETSNNLLKNILQAIKNYNVSIQKIGTKERLIWILKK